VRIVGPGRAGRSFEAALLQVGVQVELLDRDADVRGAAVGVDVVLLATPDRVIAETAQRIEPASAVVMHCSGATGLDALAPHREQQGRVASLHPLMALPDPTTGARRLMGGGWFAVAGHGVARELAEMLGGRSFEVADRHRGAYHATAAIGANHLVALLGQVERLAAGIGVPFEAFLDLARGSFDDVVAQGAAAALTGPAARGDHETIDVHRRALPADEVPVYDALAQAATKLARLRDSGN